MPGRTWPWFLLWALLAPAPASAVEAEAAELPEGLETRLLTSETVRLDLTHPFVEPGTVILRVGGEVWIAEEDYRLDPVRGVLVLRRDPVPDGGTAAAVIRYRYRPAPWPASAALHPVTTRPATGSADSSSMHGRRRERADASRGFQDLDVRGSKSVRMSSGSRRELTVDQTLRLNISGRLTEDITVAATLSDDNLPVVPEGNTEELRDIDKVRVDLRAPTWRAVLGDFVAERSATTFGGYRRKLQGAQIAAGGRRAGVTALAGSPRGRYRTVQLRGEESNQGPYALGGTGGANLFIVAASERVTVDGEAMTRGADRDYVIDYVRGTVTFTYRRLITADSEIVVEYEEGEGPYARTVAGASAAGRIAGGRARVGVSLIREQDDAQRPRLGELSDDDRERLAAAGDDPDLAVTEGVTRVEAGEGRYRLDEIGGVTVAVWDTLAGDVDVDFYNVGTGLGDYVLDSLTPAGESVFVYRGEGGGAWRIGRPLSMPERRRLLSLSAAAGDSLAPWLDAEWHLSSLDANTLSGLDDGDNDGRALRLGLNSGERRFGLGTLSASLAHERLGDRFAPFLLARDLFRYERWGLAQRAARTGFLEERDATTSAGLSWSSRRDSRHGHGLTLAWDRLDHGADLRGDALEAEGTWDYGRLTGRHLVSGASARDDVDPLDVERRRHAHTLRAELPFAAPEIGWERERFEDGAAVGTAARGARARRWRAALGAPSTSRWDWRLSLTEDRTDSLSAEAWRRERDGRTWDLRVGTPSVAGVRLTAEGTLRDVEVPDGADLTTRLASVRMNGRWPDLGSDWGLSYGIDSSRSEVLDRQIVYVGDRQGDYNQNGDFVGFELGDHQVVTVGTDSLVATTEARADLTWRQDFAWLGADRWWGGWSTYTRWSARGRSRADDVGPLLRLCHDAVFSPVDAVLGETSLRQDLNLLRHLRAWDLRLSIESSDRLDRQYAAHPERRLRRVQSAALTHHPRRDLSLRWRTRHEDDRRQTEESALSSNSSFRSESWRHEAEMRWNGGPGDQLALVADHVRRRDAVSGVAQREWGLKPSGRWKLADRWSGSAEARWSHVSSDEPAGAVRPFFYAYPGGNVDASARLNWEPSRTMTLALSVVSRRLGPERGWQHDVRMESTARF